MAENPKTQNRRQGARYGARRKAQRRTPFVCDPKIDPTVQKTHGDGGDALNHCSFNQQSSFSRLRLQLQSIETSSGPFGSTIDRDRFCRQWLQAATVVTVTSSSSSSSSPIDLMTSENTSKRDLGWKYCEKIDPHNSTKLKCIFCNEIKNGGVSRIKQHLAGGAKMNTAACRRCPLEVREEMSEFIRKRDEAKSQFKCIPDFDDAMNDDDYDLDDDDIVESDNPRSKKSSTHGSTTSASIHSKPKKPRNIGPLNTYYTPEPEVVVENRKAKGKQPKINENEPYKKILKDRAHQAIARRIYDCGIPLNVVNNDSFALMIEAIGQYGPGLPPPTYHQVRVPLLKKEVEHVNKLMEEHKKDQEQYGCTLMSDGWTDRKNRTLMNLLVNSSRGTMFLKSMDASGIVKDAEMIYELLDGWVEHIGEGNMVQVVTDSAAANVAAGRLLEAKRPHLFWSPCAVHCLDLMLEDIFKLPNLKTTWERAIMIHGYIYNQPSLLNMMRQFTQRKELFKPAKTRFATAFLTLQRVYEQKGNLRKMFTSEKWTNSKWAKEQGGKHVEKVMLMASFWRNVLLALKFASPLVKVLRLVDGEVKPPMGYIYEAMDRAKETIANSFNQNKEIYDEVFKIIDKKWESQLHRPLHAAGFYLNPEFFYKDPEVCKVPEVIGGLYKCITKLIPNNDTQDLVCADLMKYERAEGLFGNPMAIRQRNTRAPGITMITLI
ncbi:uncharacterized protein LOC131317432 [Rhododendron vialii]|uniref:uncharacterized protein LOC131317432 n=1 Tax=Rhododendron vialii TaxID=182163 RepID=UPI00265FDFDC|nr:uncharacterized protein LOC131317432 [Rhododendron vialii]